MGKVASHNVITGSRQDFFSPDGVTWSSARTTQRSGRLDEIKGEGARRDRAVNVERVSADKRINQTYITRVATRKK